MDLQQGLVQHEAASPRHELEHRAHDVCGAGLCAALLSAPSCLPPAQRCGCFKAEIIDSLPDACCHFLSILT